MIRLHARHSGFPTLLGLLLVVAVDPVPLREGSVTRFV
jgi:hypothetical protein